MGDLILLVADKNMEFTLEGALSRPEAMGIRPVINPRIITHPRRDGGVRTDGALLLALERQRFDHAIMMLDFEGSGTNEANAIALESELDARLGQERGDAAKAIVIEPELDVWMWGSDNALHQVVGRPGDASARDWLRSRGFVFTDLEKPVRPKEAMEELLREVRLPRSSAIYQKIAFAISLKACTDPAFIRLRDTLQRWFALDR